MGRWSQSPVISVSQQPISLGDKWYRAIVETSIDGIIAISATGTILAYNESAAQMFGFPESEALGQNVSSLMPTPHRQRHDGYLEQYQKTGHQNVIGKGREVDGRRRDGSTFPLRLSVVETRVDGQPVYVGVLQDLTEQKATEQRLRQAQESAERASESLRAILSEAADAIVTTDDRGRIVHFNSAAARLFGYDENEVQGRNVSILMPSEIGREHDGYIRQYLSSGMAKIIGIGREVEARRKDGTKIPVHLAVSRIGWSGGMCFSAIIHDLSEHKRVETELKQARIAAEQSAQLKSDFLATMSHEIRTPMNGVLGMLDALSAGELDEEQRTHVDVARRSAQSLLSILNDILDFSKIEAGKMELGRVPMDLPRLVHDSTELFHSSALAKNLVLRADVSSTVPRFIWGDAVRVGQIVTNLVGNAIKFTQAGSVTVEVRPALLEGNPAIAIRVHDTGIGIAEEHLPHLFDRFTQLDSTAKRRFGGTGLGLAICDRLARLMGGTIFVRSAVGKGSVFELVIPAESAPSVTPSVKSEPVRLDGLSVLVADDNDVNRRVAEQLLSRLGAKVYMANDGAEAVEMAGRIEFDVIVMDLHMPIQDGREATRAIHATQPADRRTPILAYTASVLHEDQLSCAEAGMCGFVAKPARCEDLVRAISSALGSNADSNTNAA